LTHFRSALNALELDLFPEAYGTFKKAHERAIGALEIFHEKHNESSDFISIKTCVQVELG
jgi:hypothetical protein